MSLTFTALKTEFAARGFDYLDSTRQGYYLNRAYRDIVTTEDWPFMESTATGAAPLVISDLSSVESVIDTTQQIKLEPRDRRNLTDDYSTDLSTAGTPAFYYLTQGSVVNLYPTSSDNLAVRYYKVATDLSSGSDVPLVPGSSNQLAIVDGACGYAYADSDNFSASQQAFALRDSIVEQMRETYLNWNRDKPDDYIVLTDPEFSY